MALERATLEQRAKWQAIYPRFQRTFSHYHQAIYGYCGPNLRAYPGVYRHVQVICRRNGVRPEYFVLFKLLEAHHNDGDDRFRLDLLPGDWLGFMELKRLVAQKEGSFDAGAICSFWERDDLREAILAVSEVLELSIRGGSANADGQVVSSGPRHIFARSVAEAFGGDVEAAILYQSFRYWTEYYRDQRDQKHHHEGRYWRYDSLDALVERFPYMSRTTISRKLKKLTDAGYLDVGRYNRMRMDKTRWYHAKAKDPQGNPIEAGGNIAIGIEEATTLRSAVQAAVLGVIRRTINKNLENGFGPTALLSIAEFVALLPFSPRTIRRAIDEVLRCGKIDLHEEVPPADYVDPSHPRRRFDRRLKPRIYHFGSLPVREEEPEMVSSESETATD